MTDKETVAQRIADLHYEIEPGMVRIYRVKDSPEVELLPETPIKLLEVSETTIATGIMPLYFGAAPARGRPFTTVIIEITPEEFDLVKSREMELPYGWTLGDEVPRSTHLVAGG